MPKGGKIINLLGQKFGMVTAIEIMGKNKSGNYTWKCICDCGGTKIFSSDYLRSGRSGNAQYDFINIYFLRLHFKLFFL